MTDPADNSPPEAAAPQAPRPDPQAFQLRGDPPRVMRLSRKALAAIGVVAGLGIGGSLIYALKPAGEKEAKELYSTDSRATSETITSGPRDYSQAPKLGPPLPGDLGGPIVSAQQRGENVPVPPVGAQPDPRAQAEEAARQRISQERDAARMSGVFLGGSSTGAAAMPSLPNLAIATPDATAPQPAEAAQGDQAAKRAFMAQASSQRTVSVERLTAPASPNIVQAGSIVPAALITGIRSDLPGQITAQVTANVYDSPTGRILLIPQGARLIGEYDSEIAAGQTRVLLAWDRLIMPDGRSIVLERQPGADAAGYAGLQDRVNQHWGNLLKAAAVSTLLGVGAELGADSEDDLTRALRRGSQDTINQTGQQIVRRQLNVQPTLTIRPGHPLRVVLTRDLVLEPVGGAR
ncbi:MULTISPECIES: TraB/TrbI/VirB10 family type IV secretion system protein [Sphingomonadales]|uniref:Conjugation TrbI family protein n=3 Tax=Sphingomonadaceae TaxID=41297 RepID=A0A9J9HE03_RHIWR|nr:MULTISPECIES: TrbI/VirB10 family protein [Sphingomonadaceae]ABQ70046.1 conjugation TrbI family protein [Rhizorhabdus wittichii RW1]ARR52984.1 conjugal transfer protein TraI [Rhizorhabdus wittichii DC-6]PJG48474.1 conjugal transfer protein TraI [Sphingobium sp. LB126]QTH24386.1 TrbI/VirB10 family protein [Rhizorhabdus wittichii]GAY20050.1 conjugative transfer protein TrbI [Sphingobium fuliginis]